MPGLDHFGGSIKIQKCTSPLCSIQLPSTGYTEHMQGERSPAHKPQEPGTGRHGAALQYMCALRRSFQCAVGNGVHCHEVGYKNLDLLELVFKIMGS